MIGVEPGAAARAPVRASFSRLPCFGLRPGPRLLRLGLRPGPGLLRMKY